MTDPPLPFVDLAAQYRVLQPRIEARLNAVLAAGQFILGPEVTELEAALARFSGVDQAVTVANGTDALRIALMAEGIGPGDAVFVPAFTFVATAEVVADLGATPVFVDIDRNSYNLDPAHLRSCLEETVRAGALRPRAVIPVDLFGLPADYAAIAAIADEQGLFVLADAAQSYGASRGNQRVGSLAPVTATSFYPSKPLGCYGDGGCLFTDDAARADRLRALRGHGFAAGGLAVEVGVNSRLDTLQAAVLLAKLEIFAEELAAREAVAGRYDAALAGAVTLAPRPAGSASAWALYSILLDDRDRVRDTLGQQGIASGVYYAPPLHLHPAYARFGGGAGSLPVCEEISHKILSLPMHPYLDADSGRRICRALLEALQ